MRVEERIQMAIAKYICLQYPNVMFTSDASGIKLTIGLARKLAKMRSRHKIPDMIICYPSKKYHGLFLEVKKNKHEYLKKNGKLRDSQHIQEQNKTLEMLRALGYKAEFAGGLDHAIQMIDDYMMS